MKQRLPRMLIRADAGVSIGHGHVMRMLALAQAWIHRSGSVKFLCASCPESLQSRVQKEGCSVDLLDSAIVVGSETDVQDTAKVIETWEVSVVVLDGYSFDETYVQALKATVSIPVCCIVDAEPSQLLRKLADRIVFPCVAAATEERGDDSRVLKGREYVLIRREFLEVRHCRGIQSTDRRNGVPLRLLLCMGGSDRFNASERIVQALASRLRCSQLGLRLSLRVIVGSSNPNLEALVALSASVPEELDWELQVDAWDMPAQFAWADAVISASGGMVWEWLLLGLPGAMVCIAQNQQAFYREMVDLGWATGLGDFTNDSTTLDSSVLWKWINGCTVGEDREGTCEDPPIDGLGAVRVAESLASFI